MAVVFATTSPVCVRRCVKGYLKPLTPQFTHRPLPMHAPKTMFMSSAAPNSIPWSSNLIRRVWPRSCFLFGAQAAALLPEIQAIHPGVSWTEQSRIHASSVDSDYTCMWLALRKKAWVCRWSELVLKRHHSNDDPRLLHTPTQ